MITIEKRADGHQKEEIVFRCQDAKMKAEETHWSSWSTLSATEGKQIEPHRAWNMKKHGGSNMWG